MDLKTITDNELHSLAIEENEDAKNILLDRYKYLIDFFVKKYKSSVIKFNIEESELYSEGLYGFSDALNSYSEQKAASFKTFVSLCIERRIIKYLVKENRLKNKINNEAYSLDYIYDENDLALMDLISDDSKFDPLNKMTDNEKYIELVTSIKNELSESEYSVFKLLVNGLSYKEIALILDKSPKQVDNTIQRLKLKIKKLLKLEEKC